MIGHEVTSDFAATETDLDPVLISSFWLLEAFGGFWVEWVNLKARPHGFGALLSKNPRICAACVENSSHFLRSARADIQLTDVRQVLRIG